MGFFGRHPGKRKRDKITIDRKDLEDAIVSAYFRIDEKKEQIEKQAYKKDLLTGTLVDLIRTVIFAFFLTFAIGAVGCIMSFIYPGAEILRIFLAIPKISRVVISIIMSAYAAITLVIELSLGKANNRQYALAYISALTSLLALVVALLKN